MKFPHADEKTKEFFLSVLPDDPRVQVKPMFGHLSAFVNGNMFAGFFGTDVIVRLPESEREKLVREDGASPFQPMGRAMKEYIGLPPSWRDEPEKVRQLFLASLEWAGRMPAKTIRKKRNPNSGTKP